MADHEHQGEGDGRAKMDLGINLSLTDPRGSRKASFQLNAQQDRFTECAYSSQLG